MLRKYLRESLIEVMVKIKYGESNEYSVSTDGKVWNPIKGDLTENENGNLTLNVNYNGAVTKVNIFRNDDILAIFDQVVCSCLNFTCITNNYLFFRTVSINLVSSNLHFYWRKGSSNTELRIRLWLQCLAW